MAQDRCKDRVAVIGGGIAGTSAAWALHRSGYVVELFERAPALGGNAKTFRWRVGSAVVESPLLVIAWPEQRYHNYLRLLAELGLETTSMPISTFVKHPHGIFCQDGQTDLQRQRKSDFRRWDRLVRVTGGINDLFLRKSRFDSFYDFSYWNPLNLIPCMR